MRNKTQQEKMGWRNLCCCTLLVILYTGCMVIYFHSRLKRDNHSNVYTNKLIILVSQPRSGSTYLGNLISQSIKSIYFYEPLYRVDNMLKIDINFVSDNKRQNYDTTVSEYLRHIFNCDFKEKDDWMRIFNSPFKSLSTLQGNECDEKKDALQQKPKQQEGRSYKLNHCLPYLNAHHLQRKCKTMDLMVKMLELRIPYGNVLQLKKLIHEDVQYKILYLVRDPRAAFYSLLKTGWVVKTIQDQHFREYVSLRCREMKENIKQVYGVENIVITRYEDLIVRPKRALKHLYAFLSTSDGNNILQKLQGNTCYVPKFNNLFNISLYSNRGLKSVEKQKDASKTENHEQLDNEQSDEEVEDFTEPSSQNVKEDDSENKLSDEEAFDFDSIEKNHRKNYECYSINKWRYVIDVTFVKVVEELCHDVIYMLGYKMTGGDIRIIRDIGYALVDNELNVGRKNI